MPLSARLKPFVPARPRQRSPRATARPPAPAVPEDPATASARRAGPDQDRALYNCHCGFVFPAAVTTSIACPHCGTEQAW